MTLGHALVKVEPRRARNRYWSSVDGRSRTLSSRRHRFGTSFAVQSHKRTHTAELAILAFAIITLQILDGLLTGLGMFHFGTSMEGNALLRFLMEKIGYVPALVATKGLAVCAVIALCAYASKVRWLKKALKGIIGLYVIMAIIPWSILLAVALSS